MSEQQSWPRRYLDGRTSDLRAARVRRLLRAEGRPLDDLARERAFRAIVAGARGARRRRSATAVLAAAAALALAWIGARSLRGSDDFAAPHAGLEVVHGRSEVAAGDGWRAVRARDEVALPADLRVGVDAALDVRLERDARVRLAAGSRATIAADAVELDHGAAYHSVARGRGRYAVSLGEVRVVVLGTEFWTGHDAQGAAVCVVEGRVEVQRAGRRVATLGAGEGWRSSTDAPRFGAELPCSEARRAPMTPGAGDATGRTGATASAAGASLDSSRPSSDEREEHASPRPRARAARVIEAARSLDAPVAGLVDSCTRATEPEACYRALADGDGIAAETSLYRLAQSRARRRDAAGALDALREHTRRFPNGSLAPEVDLSILEALLIEDATEARDAADRFLARHAASSYARDVHAIRATLRHRAGDCAGALDDYDRALGGRIAARRRDEASFGRAACLEALGRTADARAAYEAYLADVPEGRFVARARERLERE